MNGLEKIGTFSKDSSKPRVLIVTLDPANGGGILAMMQSAYKIAEAAGYEPSLAYNEVASLRGAKEKHGLMSFTGEANYRQEEFRGMRGFAVERVLPEFEFLNYSANIKTWEKVLAQFDRFFVVGGNALAALPLLRTGRKYAIWLATPLYEDRMDRMQRQSFLRNLRDRMSLPMLAKQEKDTLFGAERVLALSTYTADNLKDKFPEISSSISVLPYPLDAAMFSPGEKSGSREIIFTGRVEDPRKNTPMFLKAFSIAKAKLPDLRLKLVGGFLNAESKEVLEREKLQDAVEVLPPEPRENLVARYRQAGLFVIPSFQEGLCIAGLEALASGLPVISTRCGGPAEFVDDGQNGYLTPNGDAEALGQAIIRYFELPEEARRTMRAAARQKVLDSFDLKNLGPIMAANFEHAG